MKKRIDVTIRIVYPQISKEISSKDREKVAASTLLKFEKRQSLASAESSISPDLFEKPESTVAEDTQKIKEGFQDLSDEIQTYLDTADEKLSKAYYEYDIHDEKNSMMATAEEDLFGSVSGVISYDMYLQAVKFQKVARKSLQKRAELQGGLNAA